MRKRTESEGFNLAFLDVMACGLGAVILIFMLVKFNDTSPQPHDEEQRLKNELAQLIKQHNDLTSSIASASGQQQQQLSSLDEIKKQIARLQQQAAATAQSLKDKTRALATLEQAVAAAPPKAADPVAIAGKGEESYLLGLKVEGSHIGILLDHSASMTNEKLLAIIKTKIGSDSEKRSAKKWQRTKRVARWLLARAPQTAKVSVVAFNNDAKVLGPKALISMSDEGDVKQISDAIETLIPEQGTNLQSALNKIAEVAPRMTNLYVITDGLPTLGERGSGLAAFRKCSSFFGKSLTITGQCRQYLFDHSISKSRLSGVQVNVILLPLEGDPGAADAYWRWSANTGGLVISPASSWP